MAKSKPVRRNDEEERAARFDPKLFRSLPADWLRLIQEAEERGYLEFHGSRIEYKAANTFRDDFNDPEERVRAGLFAWLILDREYAADCIKLEVRIPRRQQGDFADIVVYTDSTCRVPYLVVEAKEPNTSAPDFKQAVEQAFGNSNSLRDTRYALADSGKRSALYQVAEYPHDERTENLIGERDKVPKNYGEVSQFPIIAGDPDQDIKPKPSREVENLVRKAHGLIWAGGKRDPLTAFDEWCKLLFTKVYDERHTANKDPRGFQVGRNEKDVAAANRIRQIYARAQADEPNIFTEPIKLPDDKIAQVVKTIQSVAFTQMEVDALGDAFESFFGGIFRGELGQYFTRREIARFVCAMLHPTDKDKILDPTAGSGGFLLESQIQVWQYIDEKYQGQKEQDRRKYDFAHNNVYGIEIHEKLGRICQTNLILHKDGHTNVEVDRSCLDNTFLNPTLDPKTPNFTVVVGNPPFGDTIEEGSRDHLGSNQLANFELAGGSDTVSSEIAILERSIKWLVPGKGRLGMVIPDGMLNNSGESSRCPAFRRFLFLNTRILAIVSLPDYAFRKSGAQNKTSLLFVQRLSEADQKRLEEAVDEWKDELALGDEAGGEEPTLAPVLVSGGAGDAGVEADEEEAEEQTPADRELLDRALAKALTDFDYPVFLAEAEHLGYTPAGGPSPRNDLYHLKNHRILADADTILGQFRQFEKNPGLYESSSRPDCFALRASELFTAHKSHRIDPKYHIFKHLEEMTPSSGVDVFTLGEILEQKADPVTPSDNPDTEFKTITLTQEGRLEPREAGKGNNPPDWHGVYFKEGAKWNRVHAGGLLISRIDLWKGCIGVLPAEFEGAIVTGEFPAYYIREEFKDRVSIRYLQLLLRTSYFQRAIRAITTGHSNRRRTQPGDFTALKVALPSHDVQQQIVRVIDDLDSNLSKGRARLDTKIAELDELLLGQFTHEAVTRFIESGGSGPRPGRLPTAEFKRLLHELTEGPAVPPLPADFSRADLYSDHD